MRVFDALAEQLKQLGVREIFTLMTAETLKLISELEARGVTVYHTRHEHIAIGMADGYARSSGRVGVAIVGAGVGLTNGMNALITATKAHSSVVVLVGEVAGAGSGKPAVKLVGKYVEQRGLLDSLNVRHVELLSEKAARADLAACFELAANSGELLVVQMPANVLEAEAGDAPSVIDVGVSRRLTSLSAADQSTIIDILEEPFASQRTVILAGRGAVKSGARDELLRLGELTGALLGTSAMANGLFRASPYSVGIVGTFATPVASDLLGKANLVLAFGSSLNQYTTYLGAIFGKARIIQIDDDPKALNLYRPVDMAVVADAHLAAAALADELARRSHKVTGYRTPDTASQIAEFRAEETYTDVSAPEALDPRTVMLKLNAILPRERTLVVDAGNHMDFSISHLSVPDERGFVWPMEYTSIGCALGTAIGAAIARPDRLTVLCVGDGGLMMTLAGLDTVASNKLRLLVIVSNDSGFGMEVHHLREAGYSGDSARYTNPPLESVARSLGFEAATIRQISDIEPLRERIQNLNGPMLLDCKMTTEVKASFRGLSKSVHEKERNVLAEAAPVKVAS